jgi:lysozyme family protein
MASFTIAYQIIIPQEEGYNSINERGGEMYKGIDRRRFGGWTGWKRIDEGKEDQQFPQVLEEDSLLQKLVRAFYKDHYWNRLNLDKVINQSIANELFGSGVNMGTGTAPFFCSGC